MEIAESTKEQLTEQQDMIYKDDDDVRYIPVDLPRIVSVERLKEEYRKKYNITHPDF